MKLRDIGLFLRSARTDARVQRLSSTLGPAGALEAVYAADPDPWASASPRYRYQRRKYEVLDSLLPRRRFGQALDLGCGLGSLSRLLAARAEAVLGVDVAPSAVARARAWHADLPNVRFETHDLLDLPRGLDGRFDLVAVADVIYYLSPMDGAVLRAVAARIGDLLVPGGICLLANHYFFQADPESRRSRRIRDAFAASPGFTVLAEQRRPFYLATLLEAAQRPPTPRGTRRVQPREIDRICGVAIPRTASAAGRRRPWGWPLAATGHRADETWKLDPCAARLAPWP